jgi:small subunit ribosomal protein S10
MLKPHIIIKSMNLRFSLQSFNLNSLVVYMKKIKKNLNDSDFRLISNNMPTLKKKYNVLKSPHVNKKSRDIFEYRLHGRLLTIKNVPLSEVISVLFLVYKLKPVDVSVSFKDKYK